MIKADIVHYRLLNLESFAVVLNLSHIILASPVRLNDAIFPSLLTAVHCVEKEAILLI